jgi:hypothetical protein
MATLWEIQKVVSEEQENRKQKSFLEIQRYAHNIQVDFLKFTETKEVVHYTSFPDFLTKESKSQKMELNLPDNFKNIFLFDDKLPPISEQNLHIGLLVYELLLFLQESFHKSSDMPDSIRSILNGLPPVTIFFLLFLTQTTHRKMFDDEYLEEIYNSFKKIFIPFENKKLSFQISTFPNKTN